MNPVSVKIGFSCGTSIISRLIRRLDKLPGIAPVNHVYWKFCFSRTDPNQALIYESHMRGGVQITPYEHLLAAKVKGKIYKVIEIDTGLDELQTQLLWNECVPYHNKGYDSNQIMRYYIWVRLFKRRKKKVLKLWNDKKFTCNEFVVATGREFVDKMKDLDFSFTPNGLLQLFRQK